MGAHHSLAGLLSVLVLGCAHLSHSPLEPDSLNEAAHLGVPPRDQSPLQTDRLVYTLVRQGRVYQTWAIVTYHNQRSTSVYFPQGCRIGGGEYHIARLEGDTVPAELGITFACVGGIPPLEVPSGAVRQDSVWLGGIQQTYQEDLRTFTGLFRVRYPIYSRVHDGEAVDLLPIAERRSNVFLVQYPDTTLMNQPDLTSAFRGGAEPAAARGAGGGASDAPEAWSLGRVNN